MVGYPFDTVKVHIQTQDFRNPQYRGTLDCFKSIIAKESVRGLYRGLSSPLAGVSIVNAIVFGVYGNVQRHSADPGSIRTHFLAGSVAGLVQSFVCSPMELAKTQLQVQNPRVAGLKFRGPSQCLSYIYSSEGVRGVYKGLGATVLRDIPGFATYFASYEMMMRMRENPGIFHTLMAGGFAGMISWCFTIPMDVIKSRLQVDGMLATAPKYNGFVDCLRKSYHEEGLSCFTRGLGPTMLRSFPMNAVCFLVVSTTLKYSEQMKYSQTHIRSQHKETQDNQKHKRVLQGLLHIGSAFSEAIFHSEIIEMANELYKINDEKPCPNANETVLQFNFHPKMDGNISNEWKI